MLCRVERDAACEVVARPRAPSRHLPIRIDENLTDVVGAPDVPDANDKNCGSEALRQIPERGVARDVVHRDGDQRTDALVGAVHIAALLDEVDGAGLGYGIPYPFRSSRSTSRCASLQMRGRGTM